MNGSTFDVIPALDIMGGEAVRLRRGDFRSRRVVARSPLAAALDFAAAGFSRLHLVDLDAARGEGADNFSLVAEICGRANCRVDVGGGIRTLDQVARCLDAGAAMVTVTTLAVRDLPCLEAGIRRFGAERFMVAADVKRRRLAMEGWRQVATADLFTFLDEVARLGIRRVLSTDTGRDGMLAGPALGLYRRIRAECPGIRLVASGGVRSLADVRRLKREGLSGVVVGRALYDGRIDAAALAAEQAGRG